MGRTGPILLPLPVFLLFTLASLGTAAAGAEMRYTDIGIPPEDYLKLPIQDAGSGSWVVEVELYTGGPVTVTVLSERGEGPAEVVQETHLERSFSRGTVRFTAEEGERYYLKVQSGENGAGVNVEVRAQENELFPCAIIMIIMVVAVVQVVVVVLVVARKRKMVMEQKNKGRGP